MQTKQELEDWYSEPDRWGYFTNDEDIRRRFHIINALKLAKDQYSRAIDIGCGEGFVTQFLPAKEIHGLDLSNNALNRLPANVKAVSEPVGKYDLVISTGTLYNQYDHEGIYQLIMSCASEYILIAGIQDWLIPKHFGKTIHTYSFPYREFTQNLTLYHVETGS